jgi:hypothetical protein
MKDRPILPASRGRSLLRSPIGRTLLLWCLLIVMFLTLWTVLSKPGEAPAPLENPGGFWVSQLGATTFALGTCAVIFAFIIVAAKRFNSANAAGLQSLAEGEFARAEGEFAVLFPALPLARRLQGDRLVHERAMSSYGCWYVTYHQPEAPKALAASAPP